MYGGILTTLLSKYKMLLHLKFKKQVKFCVDKTGFLKPGHICIPKDKYII